MMGELEVTAFAANLTTQQNLRTVFRIGKVVGGFITLYNTHAFVKHGLTNSGSHTDQLS